MHPLADSLARLDGRVHTARVGRPEGWLDIDAVAGDRDRFLAAMEYAAAGYDTARMDIKGNRFLEIWTWLVATPAAATILLDRRLPDIAAANLAVHPQPFGEIAPVALRSPRFWCLPVDPAAGHADATVVEDERALVLELNAMLARRHLPALVAATNAHCRRGQRALWRSATDQLIGAFTRAGAALEREDDAVALARIAGEGETPMRTEVRIRRFELDGLPSHTMHLRDGCCLYYRVNGRPPNCSNCPLIDEERRVELLAAELQAVAEA